MIRDVRVKTAFQEITLRAFDELTLEEVLLAHRLPTNLFQGYLISFGKSLRPIPLNTTIKDINEDIEIILQCIRDTDLRQILPQQTFYRKSDNPVTILRGFNLSQEKCVETIYEISEEKAKNIIASKIEGFLKQYSLAKTVLVGISGGGDSNTLVRSLKAYAVKNEPDKRYLCFTLVFEPFWPQSGALRASELCRDSSIEHYIYSESEIEKLLSMKDKLRNFYSDFLAKFGENTYDLFTTFVITLVARKLCKKNNTTEYCLGYNREDVLTELLFQLINGRKPLQYPVREFGDIRFLMPLWDIPKKILDACYPKYSSVNYQERQSTVPKPLYQRNLLFYLAHTLDDIYNNLGLSLMSGIKKLFDNDWTQVEKLEGKPDLYISPYADKQQLEEVRNLLKEYF
ncbi:MAG: hypothetical protein HY093_03220 [Candidatus Liptonbacteria bacterium]|nr:hypothetical protein [Candidatus Liptonbacteria bacterium]